jgi:leucyl/phenylalanyl-tRNA---protein transferase
VGTSRPLPEPAYDFAAAVRAADAGEDLVAVGGDLAPGTVLRAYADGVFPMGVGEGGAPPLGWWCPDPRGVLPLTEFRVSRSLRASRRRFEIRLDTAFGEVVRACAAPSRPHGWITEPIATAYQRLHDLGWAHSVECWRDGVLVGGLYGVSLRGLFAGESMFHREPDASKAALAALVALLARDGDPRRLLDVQWATPHLVRLGVVELARADYLARLRVAMTCPEPVWQT